MEACVYSYDLDPFKYCCVCGKDLVARECVDVLMGSRICANGHRLLIPKKLIDVRGQEKGLMLKVDSLDDLMIARTWLNEIHFRECFNNDAAKSLRLVYEIVAGEYGEPKHSEPGQSLKLFNYCPICSLPFHASAHQMGVMDYRLPLECSNGHLFFDRFGIDFYDNNKMIRLEVEPDPAFLGGMYRFVDHFDEYLQKFFPAQLVAVYTRLYKLAVSKLGQVANIGTEKLY